MSGRRPRQPPFQSEDVLTRALVDAQTTQFEMIMLQQRLAEMRAQAPIIAKRLETLRKQASAQRQAIGKVAAFRAREQASTAQKSAQKNLMNQVFRQNVQDSFKMTDKERGWQRIQRQINRRRKEMERRLRRK